MAGNIALVNISMVDSSLLCMDFSYLPRKIGAISEQDSITIEIKLFVFPKPYALF